MSPVAILDLASSLFFFNDTATTEIYTVSLHDALPIWANPEANRVQPVQPTNSKGGNWWQSPFCGARTNLAFSRELCLSQDDFGRDGGLHLVFALRVRTLPYGARLEPLLHHVGAAALGALLWHGLAPGDEGAVGVAVAAVERLALLGAALDDLALRALRALDPDGFLLDVLAGGVIAAGGELAEPAEFQDQVALALRALLVERLILLLRAADLFGGLAIGVSGAGQESAEAALLQDHGAAAVFAVFLFALLGHFHIGIVRLARVGALGVAGTGDELAVLAPLQDEGLAALAAHLDRNSAQ